MHDGITFEWIQGQGQGPLEVGVRSIFRSYLLHHLQWNLATNSGFLYYGAWSKKLSSDKFVKLVKVFCYVTLKMARGAIDKIENFCRPMLMKFGM